MDDRQEAAPWWSWRRIQAVPTWIRRPGREIEAEEHEFDREVAAGSKLQGGEFRLCSMWQLPFLDKAGIRERR
jgi:hypothetical protein